jgi:hypothetical protein
MWPIALWRLRRSCLAHKLEAWWNTPASLTPASGRGDQRSRIAGSWRCRGHPRRRIRPNRTVTYTHAFRCQGADELAHGALYAQATHQADDTSKSQAGQDLVSFAQDLDAFISSAIRTSPRAASPKDWPLTSKARWPWTTRRPAKTIFTLAKQGADLTAMLGDPIAAAIAEQFPMASAPRQRCRTDARLCGGSFTRADLPTHVG